MTRAWILIAAALLLAAPASAGELAGVAMSDSATIGGKSMTLKGQGLRTKYKFKVYVAGLYMTAPSEDVVSGSSARAIRMHMLRALDSSKVADSIEDGFQKNSAPQMGALRDRLDALKGMFPSVEKGDVVTLAYIPGRGTVVTSGGEELGVIEGEDFAQALFKVWFGSDPVQGTLRDGMLGK